MVSGDAEYSVEGFSNAVRFHADHLYKIENEPGVHLIWNQTGELIYAGHAFRQRWRLRQHLTGGRGSSTLHAKVGRLLDQELGREATKEEIRNWLEDCLVAWKTDPNPEKLKARIIREHQPTFSDVVPGTNVSRGWLSRRTGEASEIDSSAEELAGEGDLHPPDLQSAQAHRWLERAKVRMPFVDVGDLLVIASEGKDDPGRERLLIDRILESYTSLPFGQLFPNLVASAAPMLWSKASTRLAGILSRQGSPTWADVHTLTPERMVRGPREWRGVGSKTLRELIGQAVTLALEFEPAGQSLPAKSDVTAEAPAEPGRDSDLLEALRIVAAWGKNERGVSVLLEALRLLDDLPSDQIPSVVETAGSRLRTGLTNHLGQEYSSDFSLGVSVRGLTEILGERLLMILSQRTFEPDRSMRTTLEVIAADSNVTRERIRQLQKKAEKTIDGWLASETGGVALRAALEIRRKLGPVSTTTKAKDEIGRLLERGSVDEGLRGFTCRLLLWAAGPYYLEGQFLVVGKTRELRQKTEELLSRLAESGTSPDEAVRAIQQLGVGSNAAEIAERWLQSLDTFRFYQGRLVPWAGSLAEKAVIILSLSGRPMSKVQLVEEIGEGRPATIGNYLRDDRRFTRVDRDQYGLAEWGRSEYLGVVGLIGRELDQSGGVMPLSTLVENLAGHYSIAESSIRTYASGHPRFITVDGNVRFRRPEEGEPPRKHIRDEAQCYLIGRRWSLRRQVDYDVLRGSGRAIPVGLAVHLGLRYGEQLELTSNNGTTSIAWTSFQPTIGSLREAALRLGAEQNDWLFLLFDVKQQSVEFRLLRQDDPEHLSREHRLARLMGISDAEFQKDALTSFAAALDRPMIKRFAEVGAILRSRGEDDLASLLPEDEDSGLSVEDVLRHLGIQGADGS